MGVKNIYKTKKLRCRASFFFSCSAVHFILPDGNSVRSVHRKKKTEKEGEGWKYTWERKKKGKKKELWQGARCALRRTKTTNHSFSLSFGTCVRRVSSPSALFCFAYENIAEYGKTRRGPGASSTDSVLSYCFKIGRRVCPFTTITAPLFPFTPQ